MATTKPTKVADVKQPAVETKAKDAKYVTLVSPTGAKTEVPEGIVDALKDSGYKTVK